MGSKTLKMAQEFYESIESYEDRRGLQDEFDKVKDKKGNRESAFYRWIRDFKL